MVRKPKTATLPGLAGTGAASGLGVAAFEFNVSITDKGTVHKFLKNFTVGTQWVLNILIGLL